MQLTPVYGDEPIIRMDSMFEDPSVPLLRQRARLAELLAGLDDDQWASPTRCPGWSVQDVVAHLVSTNQFWAVSIAAGAAGSPTRFLADFDPVATPAQLVDAVRSWSPSETLERFTASNAAVGASIEAFGPDSWSAVAEAPPGHLSLRLVALHALWDSLIHERDIAIPLGLDLVEEPDEILGALAYVASLGPAFRVATGATRPGALEIVATDPAARVVVEIGTAVTVHDGPAPEGAVTITGPAVELLESLSFRVPFTAAMDDDDRWLLGGLAEVFDLVD